MRIYALGSVLLAYVTTVLAVFADDAYHIDYHHALLGLPQSKHTFFLRPQATSSASLLYTVSEKAVLGAVNPKDGSLVWRHALAGSPVHNGTGGRLVAAEGDGKVVSSYGNEVTAWDALDGKLIWSKSVTSGLEVQDLKLVTGAFTDGTEASKDVIVLAGDRSGSGPHPATLRLAGDTGNILWESEDVHGDIPLCVAASLSEVYYISKHNQLLGADKLKVTLIDSQTGKQNRQYSLNTAIDLDDVERHLTVSSSNPPYLVWLEKPYSFVKVNLLGTSKISSVELDTKGGYGDHGTISIHSADQENALPHFLVHMRGATQDWAEIFHVDLKNGGVSKAYSLEATQEQSAFSASSIDANVYFTRVTNSMITLYSSASHGRLSRWPRHEKGHGEPDHVAAEVVSRGQTSYAIRVAEASIAGEWSLVRNGEGVWSRPEILASTVAAAWADNIDGADLVRALEAEVSSNPLSAYVHRLQRHISDLKYLPKWLQQLPGSFLSGLFVSGDGSTKRLVGSRNLIVATSGKQILALDSNDGGTIKWSQSDLARAGNIAAPTCIKTLYVRNGKVIVYFDDGSSAALLNATDGSIIGEKTDLPPFDKMTQVAGMHGLDPVKVLTDGTPQRADTFDTTAPIEGSSLVTLSASGNAVGWNMGSSPYKVWTLRPTAGFKFVNAVSRSIHDPIAAIGNTLGDRNVLYKYLSPNLAVLTALSSTALTMYLVEAITGAVLYTSTHEGINALAPVTSAMAENWFAYSYMEGQTGDSATSYQLVVAELYESDIVNDRGILQSATNVSSFDPGAVSKPHVRSQVFTIPQPISHMAVSQTSQGITSRQLLCSFPDSSSIAGIPRHLLDPRRPVDRAPTASEQEEGLFQYSPILELDSRTYLTHMREVIGVEKIMSSPSLLESTSLVFAYGHDIFGTRINPSGSFDVLGKNFNKVQLLLTVVALAAGVGALAPMVRKRQVDQRWKM